MNKTTTIVLATASLFLGSLFAHATPERMGQSAQQRFAAMDANNDGIVSKEEFFAAQPQMRESAFGALDTNGDGNLSLEEWLAFSATHGNEKKADSHQGDSGAASHATTKSEGKQTPAKQKLVE